MRVRELLFLMLYLENNGCDMYMPILYMLLGYAYNDVYTSGVYEERIAFQ
jgi:hypothetical protein